MATTAKPHGGERQIAPLREFHINAEDIKNAVRNDSRHCMIADAIERAYGATHVTVDRRAIRFTQDGRRYVYMTPPLAGDALYRFDTGAPVRPFRVQLKDGYSAACSSGLKVHKKKSKADAKGKRKRKTVVVKTRLDGYQMVLGQR